MYLISWEITVSNCLTYLNYTYKVSNLLVCEMTHRIPLGLAHELHGPLSSSNDFITSSYAQS